jgi:hypothetical protein
MENELHLYKVVIQTKNYFVLKDFYLKSMMLEQEFADDSAGITECKMGKGFLRIERVREHPTTKNIFGLSTKDWREAKTHFSNLHISTSGVKVKEGKCMFEIADPDGNLIQIIEVK